DEGGHHADRQGETGAVDELAPHVPPQVVGAEPRIGAWAGQGRFPEGERVVLGDPGGEDRDDEEHGDDDRADGGVLSLGPPDTRDAVRCHSVTLGSRTPYRMSAMRLMTTTAEVSTMNTPATTG